eukprot:3700021-Pyramimonas_sp.AAC.1
MAENFSTLIGGMDISWRDPRSQQLHEIRARGDLPMDVRARQRAASLVWQGTLELLRGGGQDMAGYRLGTNGFQGLVHFSSAEEVYELFWIRGCPQTGYTYDP